MQNTPHFQQIADSTSLMISVWGLDKRHVYFNRAWLDFTRRSLSQELGDGWLDNVHPDDVNHCLEMIDRAYELREPFSSKFRLRRFDGEYRVFLCNSAPWLDNNGHFAGYIGTSVDVTAQELAERTHDTDPLVRTLPSSLQGDLEDLEASDTVLRQQNAYLTALHDISFGLFNRLDEASLLEAIMRRAGELIGSPHGFVDIVLPDEGMVEMQVGVGVYSRYIGYRKKKGEGVSGQIWQHGQPMIVNNYPAWEHRSEQFLSGDFHAVMSAPLISVTSGEIMGIVGLAYIGPEQRFSQDQLITLKRFAQLAATALENARIYAEIKRRTEDLEHHIAERTLELDMQRRRLETILQNVADAIVFTDLSGRILYVNPAWERLTGYSLNEVLGSNPRVLQSGHTPPEAYQAMWAAILKGETWNGVLKNRRKNQELYDAEQVIVPVRDTHGAIQYFVGVQHDVTEAMKLQEQQTRFVANAAHELRTPLTNFNTRLYLIRKQPEKSAYHLSILKEATDHMTRLVTDLLDLSRFKSGIIPLHPEAMDLKESVRKIIEIMQPEADGKNIRVTTKLPDDSLPLFADSVRIEQVITNLIANAIHYTPESGQIEVEVAVGENGGQSGSHAVSLSVRDNGIGIAAEHLPHIFEPFYRVNEEKVGTGLGLSITREIIERHGGQIQVVSSRNGTVFTVKLPLMNGDTHPSSARTM
ncbi:MAG: PAS domain S-box protein [Anaerolineae bacterium]